MEALDKYKLFDDLVAMGREKSGNHGWAYAFGVISTYLTEKDLLDLKRFVERNK